MASYGAAKKSARSMVVPSTRKSWEGGPAAEAPPDRRRVYLAGRYWALTAGAFLRAANH